MEYPAFDEIESLFSRTKISPRRAREETRVDRGDPAVFRGRSARFTFENPRQPRNIAKLGSRRWPAIVY